MQLKWVTVSFVALHLQEDKYSQLIHFKSYIIQNLETMAEVSIRLMKDEDIGQISEWTREEGISITEFDLEVFRVTHPHDFFVAEVDGKPVGKLSSIFRIPFRLK